MKKDKGILSFPAGKTYELILHTNIHAHPVKKGYPKESTSCVMFRKRGGEMDCLYRVIKTVDLYVQDILADNVSLCSITDSEFVRVKMYVTERMEKNGFKYMTEYPYRFYLLEKIHTLSPPIVKRPNIQGYYYYKPEGN